MRLNLLQNLSKLKSFLTKPNTALFTDLDGTISEIAPEPSLAVVKHSMREALHSLSGKVHIVILTGRSSKEACKLVGLPELTYLGNHGLERWEGGKLSLTPGLEERLAPFLKAKAALYPLLAGHDVFLEDKGASFSVHYRNASDPVMAQRLVMESLERVGLEYFRLMEGKYALNVLPDLGLNKGTGLAQLVKEKGFYQVVVIGDEHTDVDAFRAVGRLEKARVVRGLTIAVAGEGMSPQVLNKADYVLNGVDEVEAFFRWWASLSP